MQQDRAHSRLLHQSGLQVGDLVLQKLKGHGFFGHAPNDTGCSYTHTHTHTRPRTHARTHARQVPTEGAGHVASITLSHCKGHSKSTLLCRREQASCVHPRVLCILLQLLLQRPPCTTTGRLRCMTGQAETTLCQRPASASAPPLHRSGSQQAEW